MEGYNEAGEANGALSRAKKRGRGETRSSIEVVGSAGNVEVLAGGARMAERTSALMDTWLESGRSEKGGNPGAGELSGGRRMNESRASTACTRCSWRAGNTAAFTR